MTNGEKWEKTIECIGNENTAVRNGTPCCCNDVTCNECDLWADKECEDAFNEWKEREYEE